RLSRVPTPPSVRVPVTSVGKSTFALSHDGAGPHSLPRAPCMMTASPTFTDTLRTYSAWTPSKVAAGSGAAARERYGHSHHAASTTTAEAARAIPINSTRLLEGASSGASSMDASFSWSSTPVLALTYNRFQRSSN